MSLLVEHCIDIALLVTVAIGCMGMARCTVTVSVHVTVATYDLCELAL